MLLAPKKLTYSKYHFRRPRFEKHKLNLIKGSVYLVSNDSFLFTAAQIEACRKIIIHYTPKKFLRIHIFPDLPITRKPENSRMGKGKGSIDFWAIQIPKNKILFELTFLHEFSENAFKQAQFRIPGRTQIIYG